MFSRFELLASPAVGCLEQLERFRVSVSTIFLEQRNHYQAERQIKQLRLEMTQKI
jgi:hypothetical protein